jgi:hypothetical protein
MHGTTRQVCLLFGWLMYAAVASAQEPAPPPAPEQMSARVDELLAAEWASAGLAPAPLADDATFFRRASLDLTGVIPSVGDVRAFLADAAPDKRAVWIDRLLSRPRHATHLAAEWRKALLPSNADVQQFGGDAGFVFWLRAQFADNKPYDALVRELLTATGTPNQAGPALYYTALQLKPEELAASTSRMFLGVQIQCAQCHKHPFDHWTQEDFWGYAAFFARLQPPPQGQAFAFQVADAELGEVKLPEGDTIVAPKYLGGLAAADEAGVTRRTQLAAWVTSAENPYFARAAVNRVWALLFGRGLVEPVDDLGAHNPASHPQVLDDLAAWFASSGYNLRQLVRVLALTQAYQRSSESGEGDALPPESFARMAVKSLTAEQLYDCLVEAMRRREGAGGVQPGFELFDQNRLLFLARFQAPTQGATEYQSGIPQALSLMNGGIVAEATDLARSDLLGALELPLFTPEQQVEVLFLSTLSRLPSADERAPLVEYVSSGGAAGDRRQALADVLWALLNGAEFALNH